MKDRFKFRVWCENNKEWEIDEICISNKHRYIINQKLFSEEEPKHHIINFCTGLKDKNGKLIYEGDIINIWCKNLTKNQISDVFYCEERAAFCFHYETDYGNIVPCTMDKTEIEVIGNIYENIELLKEGE